MGGWIGEALIEDSGTLAPDPREGRGRAVPRQRGDGKSVTRELDRLGQSRNFVFGGNWIRTVSGLGQGLT